VTPRRRTRGPCGSGLRPPTCSLVEPQVSPRFSRFLVHEASRRVWGLRLRRTEQELALSRLFMLPPHITRASASGLSVYGAEYPPRLSSVYAFAVYLAYQRKTRAEQIGRVGRWPRTGLRMMPTFPSSPLKFRTVSFPQYGFKVGWSKRCLPSIRRPIVVPVWFASLLRAPRFQTCISPRCVGAVVRLSTAIRAFRAALPQGPRSGPGYSVPVHQHLIDPIRPAHRHILISPLSGLYEMPSLCIPGLGDHEWFRAFAAHSFSACHLLRPRGALGCFCPNIFTDGAGLRQE